jgi:hypothetical protein
VLYIQQKFCKRINFLRSMARESTLGYDVDFDVSFWSIAALPLTEWLLRTC